MLKANVTEDIMSAIQRPNIKRWCVVDRRSWDLYSMHRIMKEQKVEIIPGIIKFIMTLVSLRFWIMANSFD